MPNFRVHSDFLPKGDQPKAIESICQGMLANHQHQILKGVTGSGKTYVMAKVIEELQRPTLIITHNKTLVGQLYQEFRNFFSENAVEYFVSYYDYYQPEAYVPSRDIFIEKDSRINDEIDYLRHRATASLFEREDIIIVASVSSIYGLGSPENYDDQKLRLAIGEEIDRDEVLRDLVKVQYERSEYLGRGNFRARGDVVEIFPKSSETAIRIEFFGDEVERIAEYDPLTGVVFRELDDVNIYPAQHYVTPTNHRDSALTKIREEMDVMEQHFLKQEKFIEAQRIRERTSFDLEMIQEIGFCKGIENYSRHLEGRSEGSPPATLLHYLPHNGMVFLDESHVTIPQLKGMYNGDQARKSNLVQFGFRLPSALDNRPLKYEEFRKFAPQTLYVSATPGPVELEDARDRSVPLIVRPTGLLDPVIEVRPLKFQVDDIMEECRQRALKDQRVFITTLTKKMAEDLTEYLDENGIRCKYLHSEIQTIERLELIRQLRLGVFDVLIGINLLREGLDVPEVSLVCVMDADKEGFLRSASSLIQISGRAARNVNGRVIMYADVLTDSIKAAIREADNRREIQQAYNKEHGIVPQSVIKSVADSIQEEIPQSDEPREEKLNQEITDFLSSKPDTAQINQKVVQLNTMMQRAAESLDFERAAELRDQIFRLQGDSNRKQVKKQRNF